MGEECERCGITREDYGNCEWDNFGGQELCEECSEEAKEEDRFISQEDSE